MGKAKLTKSNFTKYSLISLIGVAIIYIIPFIIAQFNFNPELLNFKTGIFSSKAFIISAGNTIMFMAVFVPIIVILGFVLAYLTEYMKFGLATKAAIILPITVPVLSIAGFFRDNMDGIFKMLSGGIVVGIIFLWSCLGFTYLIFLVSLSNRNKSIEEAAYLDGAGTMRTIFKIIIPSHTEALILSIIISIYNSLKIFKQTYAMFGEYPNYDMFMMQNYLYLKLKRMDLESLIVSADIFLIFIFCVLIAVLAFGKMQGNKLAR